MEVTVSYTGSFCGFGSSTAGTDSAACASTGAVSGAAVCAGAIPIESTATSGSATGSISGSLSSMVSMSGIEGSFMAKKYPSPPPAISPIAIHSHSRLRRRGSSAGVLSSVGSSSAGSSSAGSGSGCGGAGAAGISEGV